MSDDRTRLTPQDASRIALGENYKVDYWTGKFGVTRDELEHAVQSAGNRADAVARHFAGRS